jgi:aspartyl-tRNA(Asn)/glutamyl-tRNA(Gln) amidotransferase subunit B
MVHDDRSRTTMPAFEAVIGLEVHAQLDTASKIFCGCSTAFGAPPNSHTCPVCLGHPGALPVLNGGAVELAVRAALALGGDVQSDSVFARKHYFYPDLPKGYQISQYESPLSVGGAVTIELRGGAEKTIRLLRLHLEEDAGKSIHDGMPDSDRFSYVDLNRAGVPLVEIVSAPDLRSPEEAYLFLQRLRSILRYTGVCRADMERGELRCDANVSIRPPGSTRYGTRTELKNLNSFRNVQRALEHEILRQGEVVAGGATVVQETVLWDAAAGRTRPMRGKEEAHDYRYFPDPDLPPVAVDTASFAAIRSGLPELPAERKRRMARAFELTEYEASLLTLERAVADFYERVVELSGNAKAAANFVLNDLPREQNATGRSEGDIPLAPENLAELIRLVDRGALSVTVARQELFGEVYRTGRSPAELMRERGLEQVSDAGELVALVRQVVSDHPDQVALYRAGKTGVLGFLIGKVMKASGSRANPQTVRDLLVEEIG